MEMGERNGIGGLVAAENQTEATDFSAVAHARPIISRGPGQDLELEEASATTGSEEDGLYLNANQTEHVVLETKSTFLGVAMDADDDTPVQIPLSTLAEGGEGSEDKKFENAALIALEGERHEKLSCHPAGRHRQWRLLAYKIHHNPLFYFVCLVDALALMGLGVAETPSVEFEDIFIFHILELFLLLFLLFDFVLRLVWQGVRSFSTNRNLIMTVLLIFLMFELMVVLFRQERHPRYSRALRPLFLVDAYLLYGVRRVLRHIMDCLGSILDVLVVLFYLILFFAITGYLLFLNTNKTFFDSFGKSFVSLVVTLTTANHPDVLMEAYYHSPFAPLFFVCYLFVTLYYFLNVLLAVVFAKFRDAEKSKFKKIHLCRSESLLAVFKLLQKDNRLQFCDFAKFMEKFKPLLAMHKVICIFKSLQQGNSPQQDNHATPDYLTAEQFSHLYEHLNLNWKLEKQNCTHCRVEALRNCIRYGILNSVMSIVVFLNMVYLIAFLVLYFDVFCDQNCTRRDFAMKSLPGSVVFTTIYVLELILRMAINGWRKYLSKRRNRLDILIITVSLICVVLEFFTTEHLVIVRSLKLLRFIRFKKRYYMFVRIARVLMFRLLSILILLFALYYFFAIIGMEVFGGPDSTVYKGCCKTAWYNVGQYYAGNDSNTPNVYWLNDFDDLYSSFITLYEEMVVNNWFIQMEGFASTTSHFARVYFIVFWLTTTIVVNINIVYFVDAFETGILLAKEKTTSPAQRKSDKEKTTSPAGCTSDKEETTSAAQLLKKVVTVTFDTEEFKQLHDKATQMNEPAFSRPIRNYLVKKIRHFTDVTPKDTEGMITFVGKRVMNNDDLKHEMYKADIKDWVKERKKLRKKISESGSSSGEQQGKDRKDFWPRARKMLVRLVVYMLE